MSKQTKDIPEGYKMTELGPLPGEWEVTSLSNVVIKAKQSNPKKTPDWHFKYIDVSGINRDSLYIEETRDYIGEKAPSRARKKIKAGDVLFATVRPYLKRLSIVPESLDGQICSTAFCVIRANRQVAEPYYLFYAAADDRFVGRISEKQRGSSYPAVTDKNVLSENIALPPLPEQKKIASVLSMVQQAREKTEGAIAALRVLKKSLMKHLFTYGPVPVDEAENIELKETEIGRVPKDWEVKELVNIATLQRGKDLPSHKQIPGPYPIVGSSGIIGYHKEYVSEGPGVVTGRSGSIGKLTYVEERYWPHNTGLYVKEFHGNLPKFVFYLLQMLDFKRYATGVSVPTLNRNFVHSAKLPQPRKNIQSNIAKTLQTIDTKLDTLENEKRSLDDLFHTLLHDLMTAKIRVNEAEVPV